MDMDERNAFKTRCADETQLKELSTTYRMYKIQQVVQKSCMVDPPEEFAETKYPKVDFSVKS